jgi:hypothetical protein
MTTAIIQLEDLGYAVSVAGSAVRVRFVGAGDPPAAVARPLIEWLATHKSEVIAFLSQRHATAATVQRCPETPGTTEAFTPDANCNGQTTVQQAEANRRSEAERCSTVALTVAEAEIEKLSVAPTLSQHRCTIAPLQPSTTEAEELVLWCLVDRVDCEGRSFRLAPICVQALASNRLDRSSWAQLGNGWWWATEYLRRAGDDQ